MRPLSVPWSWSTFDALAAFAASPLGQKYPQAARVWENAWDRFTPFLAFTPPVRKLLYTTNSIVIWSRFSGAYHVVDGSSRRVVDTVI